MRTRLPMSLAIALAAATTMQVRDALAREKIMRLAPDVSSQVTRDYDGTPIIMQGFRRSRGKQLPAPGKHVDIPRGSGTYIPPSAPSLTGTPPAAALLQPPAAPYRPPPINSFSDRVTSCIHSYPLNAGVGNNPANQQMYIRQCAN